MDQPVYELIKTEENAWKTTRIPLTNSKDWNMHEHIERCFNVSNGWFHSGANDGNRPYDDIVTPIIDVAFRTEGFDVKDIIPYVDDAEESCKSFLVKKYHPQWARKNQLDTFIDEVVESSIIYDLVLIKDVSNVRPEVVKLQEIAFCDQSDVLAGPLCLRHAYTPSELKEYTGKWDADKIDEAIIMADASKKVALANDKKAKTPGKYIEVYELYGNFPESWLKDDGDPDKYVDQMHIVCFYQSEDNSKNGITLFKGKSKGIRKKFKALKIDQVRSHGRACGRSVVERLFEPQVWANYSGIKLKKMLDASVNLLQTEDEEIGGKKLSQLSENTVIKHAQGKPLTRVDMGIQNFQAVQSYKVDQVNSARLLGSASDAQLGENPVAGTPFSLQQLIVQQGEGIHEYRRGKIATFFADELYPDMILGYLVREMNKGIKFSEELSLDELESIAEVISTNAANQRVKDFILAGGRPTPDEAEALRQLYLQTFKKGDKRKFMELVEGEIGDIPVKVFVNVAGKQRYMAQNADKLSNLITTLLRAGVPITGMSKAVNQLLEESGMSPVDFGGLISQAKPVPSPIQVNQPVTQ